MQGKVAEKWRSLEATYRREASKVADSRRRATQTGACIAEEDSVAYQSQWHLWGLFRQINRGSSADQLEQEGMGIVTESAAPGVQPAAPDSSQVAAHDASPQDKTDTQWCPPTLPGTHYFCYVFNDDIIL